MSLKNPRVIVVGAGIVGGSLAYHLARRNARVTLIDKMPRPAQGVTGQSFAWIATAHDAPEAYFNLRQLAIADWRRVEDELNGRLKVDWSGALTWHRDLADTARIVHELQKFNDEVRLVGKPEIQILEPNLVHVPEQAMFAGNEGAIDSVQATGVFVEAAREAGAGIQFDNEVLSLVTSGTRVTGVRTTNGDISADVVVFAASTDTAKLCQPLGLVIPVDASPAILMHFQTNRRFVNRIISNPLMEIRAASNTLVLGAEDYVDESLANSPLAIAQRTLENIKTNWRGAEQIKLTNVMIGSRPIPSDGLPVIGHVNSIDGLYLSVMHAGVTLAPGAGRLAAEEILSGQELSLLSPYRLDRFDR